MARKKIPENETQEETQDRILKESIANKSSRSEKTSWNRKMDNMVSLMAKLQPIEEQIIELQAQKVPLFDEIQELRNVMVNECTHPYEYLSVKDGYVHCTFCLKKINVNNVKS